MRVTGGAAPRFDGRDVHVVLGREHHRILGDFIVVKRESLAALQPRIEGEHRDGAMVAVTIDGPLREYDIRPFRGQQAREILVVWGIDDRPAVVLTGENGAGLETLTSLPGFGGANGATAVEALSAAESLSAVQVEQNHLVAQLRVACDRPGAAAFRDDGTLHGAEIGRAQGR